MRIAIDPGNVQSAIVAVPDDSFNPQLGFAAILPNDDAREWLYNHTTSADEVVIEMVASYGMPVGAEVFDTVFWIGRFYESLRARGVGVHRMFRRDVKLHICHVSRAKDANIRQALIDRFGGVGVKKAPGWFYGFKADIWAAYALAVTYFEQQEAHHQ